MLIEMYRSHDQKLIQLHFNVHVIILSSWLIVTGNRPAERCHVYAAHVQCCAQEQRHGRAAAHRCRQ